MSTVVDRYILTPLYNRDLAKYPIEHYWHDPDLTDVIDVNPIYWKEVDGDFSEMDSTEKINKDIEIETAIINSDKHYAKREIDNNDVLKAFAWVLVNEINTLRAQHGLNPRTLQQLVDAIKNKLDQ